MNHDVIAVLLLEFCDFFGNVVFDQDGMDVPCSRSETALRAQSIC